MVAELTVVVKNEEKTLRMKHLIYDPFQVVDTDPTLCRCVDDAVKQFGEPPTDVSVRISMEIQ